MLDRSILILKYRENVSDAIFRHILQKLFFFLKKSLERQKGSEQDGGGVGGFRSPPPPCERPYVIY